jgi:hypothetical protein
VIRSGTLIGDGGNDTTGIGVTADNYIRTLFLLNEIHDIGMSRKIDSRRIDVRPFAQASNGRCEYAVPGQLNRRQTRVQHQLRDQAVN